MVDILYYGVTYKKTPVEQREAFVFTEDALLSLYRRFKGKSPIAEFLYLTTCNRSEFYLAHTDEEKTRTLMRDVFLEHTGGNINLEENIIELKGLDAARHLLEVASGIDSMVMGEPQILGQVKQAYENSRHIGSVGVVLDRLARLAIRTGKRAREETDIGVGSVSVSFASVELAKKIFGRLDNKTIALVGIGEMGTLCAKHLRSAGVGKLFLLNRTFEKSLSLAEELEGSPVPYEELYPTLAMADVVISSTSAREYVIHVEPFKEHVMSKKRQILLIDIAIPRDVDPAIGDMSGVFLYDIDDLECIVDSNLKRRMQEVEKVKYIIDDEMNFFASWIGSLDVKPTILSLRQKASELRQEELKRYKNLSENEKQLLEKATNGLMNKLLHLPISNLKKAPTDEEKLCHIHSLNFLFCLQKENRKDSGK